MWFLYILECENNFLYTGVTQDLKRRFQEHVRGVGGYFTSKHQAKKIVHFEGFETEYLARQRESQIKRWRRSKKQALIKGQLKQLRELSISRD